MNIFLILQFILAVVITVAVLLQKSSSIGLGAYSGSNESLFGAKGPAGFLAKFTFILAILFVANTLILGYSYNKEMRRSIIDSVNIDSVIQKASQNQTIPAKSVPQAPVTPTVPAAPQTSNK
ncbi:MAG: preprotein translocase subunit SecG [Campylobacter sp.]|nr:preprotein translocase subunit SecG [Campylobacter sp.]